MLRCSIRRFQKVNDGIKGRRYEDRHILASGFQKNAEEQSAEKSFLNNRDNNCSGDNFCEASPIDRAADRKDGRRNQDRAAAEQGSGREDEACYYIPPAMRISSELQIIQAADFQRSNQWPKQNQGGEKQRAMKKSFEIVSREKS